MTSIALSPELCSRIVQWTRQTYDLAALCLTCKAFQREAEAKLYDTLHLGDPQVTYLACQSLVSDRLAAYVHTLYIWQDQRHIHRTSALPAQYWQAVQVALTKTRNLEVLVIYDTTFANTWILDPTHIKFQLRQARLRFQWDQYLVSFIQSQRKLCNLQLSHGPEDELRLMPDSLPQLQIYDGPMSVAAALAILPLEHLQTIVDCDVSRLIPFVSRLVRCNPSLQSLNIIDIPEAMSLEIMRLVSVGSPALRFLGLITLPWHDRYLIYENLMRMQYLTAVEFDIASWAPQPNTGFQRALVCEIRMYCPSIQSVVFWIVPKLSRFVWVLEGDEWQQHRNGAVLPHSGSLWRSYLPADAS